MWIKTSFFFWLCIIKWYHWINTIILNQDVLPSFVFLAVIINWYHKTEYMKTYTCYNFRVMDHSYLLKLSLFSFRNSAKSCAFLRPIGHKVHLKFKSSIASHAPGTIILKTHTNSYNKSNIHMYDYSLSSNIMTNLSKQYPIKNIERWIHL